MRSSSSGRCPQVLVADHDDAMRASVAEALHAHGCETQEARNGEEVLDLLIVTLREPARRPDVIVAEVKMPRLSGLGVLAAMKRSGCAVPLIMTCAFADESIHTAARRGGALRVLDKPFKPDDLVHAVHYVLALGSNRNG